MELNHFRIFDKIMYEIIEIVINRFWPKRNSPAFSRDPQHRT